MLRKLQSLRVRTLALATAMGLAMLAVIAGNAKVQVELDEATQVEIDLESLQYAGSGHAVSITGNYYEPNWIVAKSIDVTFLPPTKSKPKKPPQLRTNERKPEMDVRQ